MFGSVESVKAVSDLFAPVTGKVVKVNSPLGDSPEHVNEDPYDEGWMIEIEPSATPTSSTACWTPTAYQAFLREQARVDCGPPMAVDSRPRDRFAARHIGPDDATTSPTMLRAARRRVARRARSTETVPADIRLAARAGPAARR